MQPTDLVRPGSACTGFWHCALWEWPTHITFLHWPSDPRPHFGLPLGDRALHLVGVLFERLCGLRALFPCLPPPLCVCHCVLHYWGRPWCSSSSLSLSSTTTTSTQRRHQRRLRARARVDWYLHKTGKCTLHATRLANIYRTLSVHHSKDLTFLKIIRRAMAQQKNPSWRCTTCHVVMKGTFPRCWKCGVEWAQCADRAFVPPEYRQSQQHSHQGQQGQMQSWDHSSWQQQRPKSPRTKNRRPSRSKHRGNQNAWQGDHPQQQQGKGRGKGQGQDYAAPPMMQHMGPMMMPYCPQTPVPMMMDKGFGKGMNYPAQVPMPPLPPPSAPLPGTMAPVAPPTWVPNMQMIPIPIPPAMPASSTEDLEQKAEATAQKKLNKLLAAMKKEEDALSP